jgi:TPR repeat protein
MKKLVILAVLIVGAAGAGEYERGDEAYSKGFYAEAYNIWLAACEKGDAESCNGVGYLYNNDYGVKQNYQKAADYYKKACDLGYGHGCNNLGILYRFEFKNGKKGVELYALACDKKDGNGCFNLAHEHYIGVYASKDIAKAKTLFDKACSLGDRNGCEEAKQLNEGKTLIFGAHTTFRSRANSVLLLYTTTSSSKNP